MVVQTVDLRFHVTGTVCQVSVNVGKRWCHGRGSIYHRPYSGLYLGGRRLGEGRRKTVRAFLDHRPCAAQRNARNCTGVRHFVHVQQWYGVILFLWASCVLDFCVAESSSIKGANA